MKRFLAFFLIIICVFMLASCMPEDAIEYSSDTLFAYLSEDIINKEEGTSLNFKDAYISDAINADISSFMESSLVFSKLVSNVHIETSESPFYTGVDITYDYIKGAHEKYDIKNADSYTFDAFAKKVLDMVQAKKDEGVLVFKKDDTSAEDILKDEYSAFTEYAESTFFLNGINTEVTEYTDYILLETEAVWREDAASSIFYYEGDNLAEISEYIAKKCVSINETFAVCAPNFTTADIFHAYDMALANDPETIVITPSNYNYMVFPSDEPGALIVEITIQPPTDLKVITEMQRELSSRLNDYEFLLNEHCTTDEEKLRKACELICQDAYYDTDISSMIDEDELFYEDVEFMTHRTAYGAIFTGATICTGYAGALKAVCDRLGIPAWNIGGYVYGDEPHEWTAVLVGGEKKYIDLTFIDTGYSRESGFDKYFLFDKEDYENDDRSEDDYWACPF